MTDGCKHSVNIWIGAKLNFRNRGTVRKLKNNAKNNVPEFQPDQQSGDTIRGAHGVGGNIIVIRMMLLERLFF